MTQDKQRRSDRQSLIKAHAAQARRARRAALKVLKEFAQSPRGQAIRRAWRDAQERGLVSKIPAEIEEKLASLRNETKEARNARLDEQWRRMQAESEEDRNARLDERWRELQEAWKAQEREEAAMRAALVKTEPVEMKPAHRQGKEIPHWPEAMAYLKSERVRNPRMLKKTEVETVVDWLFRKHGVEIVEPEDAKKAKKAKTNPNVIMLSRKQIGRRIDDWFRACTHKIAIGDSNLINVRPDSKR